MRDPHAQTTWPATASPRRHSRGRARLTLCVIAVLTATLGAHAQDVSPAPILQWFEGTYETQIDRAPDLFMAGYGTVWAPPPGRADLSDFSVGYDVYDRFDLGAWDRKTLYGTQTGFQRFAELLHRQGGQMHVDAIINHNGFSDASTPGFLEAGGYPGFLLQNPDGGNDPFGVPNTDGDFNSAFDFGTIRERLAGLIDIDHATNWQFIRHPVDPGDPNNLPAGWTPDGAGRLANVPDPNNRRFYPDRDGPAIFVFDPVTGEQNIPIYSFNVDDPMAGDPVAENATGLLMRYMQWMVQVNGVDGFRIDAAKHVEGFTFDFLDRAVYRQNPRLNLDGSTNHVFSYSEVFDSDRGFLQTFVKKNIDPNDPGRVGANRDVLDFAQYFALRGNLTGNGAANDWNNVVNAGQDVFDDGLKNGSAGVMFVRSHDEFGPDMGNVAHAYMLLHPGNAVVYFNGKEHGEGRDFPKDGRGDALGGVFGDTVTDLVEIRNTHGRGNYIERWLEKENFAFEREGSMLVLLSNRNDGGFDSRTVNVNLPFGTPLIELTGNAKRWNDQVGGTDIPELIQVTDDGPNTQTKVNVRFLRNNGQDRGYLVYGLATPQSSNGLELTNVDSVLPGGTPEPNGFSNGTTRLTDLHVIKDDQFTLRLDTLPANLLGFFRDRDADGDNALFKIDGGLDANGNGQVDFVTPGGVTYGFEQFTTTHQPGFFDPDGNGRYEQLIDTTILDEGVYFITARAFRHRDDGGPAVFSDFKKVIYVDRLPPISAIGEARQVNDPGFGDHDFLVDSLDFTADSMHVFLNLPAAMDQQTVLDMALDGQGAAERVDVARFKKFFGGVGEGNNVLTVVTFEPTGTSNVQRFTGQYLPGGRGAGFGDLNFDGARSVEDVAGTSFGFEAVLYSQDTAFNPAADINGDGRVGWADLIGLENELIVGGASQAALDEYDAMLLRRGNVNQQFGTDSFDIDAAFDRFGTDDWFADIDSSGTVDQTDVGLLVGTILGTHFGDANLDRRVDEFDLSILADNWQAADTRWGLADFTGDEVTDEDDLIVLAENWFAHDPGAAPISAEQLLASFGVDIPEPGTLAAFAMVFVLVTRRRTHRLRCAHA